MHSSTRRNRPNFLRRAIRCPDGTPTTFLAERRCPQRANGYIFGGAEERVRPRLNLSLTAKWCRFAVRRKEREPLRDSNQRIKIVTVVFKQLCF